MILDLAKIIREDFLQQNGYSDYDNYCPFDKTKKMASNIAFYYKCTLSSLKTVKWSELKIKTSKILYELTQMKFLKANDNFITKLQSLRDEIEEKFKSEE
ncbi:VATA [Hepatospora eriocheir]|uniref:VATA n=1 Tax=Hepatospora eriocheir TaxID=1081669 RepID=A0A1X0Q697_9MICR|nr:VATA [Hepatospora eriocheir]